MDRNLSIGVSGQDVRALQDVLNYHIRRETPIKVDGVFGPKTSVRVKEFQRANSLTTDGVVGPKTRAMLFEESTVDVSILFMPRLQLSQPGKPGSSFGIKPPRLIPPLQFPSLLPPLAPVNLSLPQNSSAFLPALGAPANAFKFTLTVPTRQDPLDPALQSRKAIIELIDDLPVNSQFKAFLISQVPNPVTKISPPTPGFKWGVAPLFDPFDPKGFGVKGNAQFTIRVTGGTSPALPSIAFALLGDGSVFLDFTSKQGATRPRAILQGQLFLGLQGTF